MATSVTLIEAQEMLALYIEAEKHILLGQSYTIKDRTLTRADLRTVAQERRKWQTIVDTLINEGSVRVRRVLPVDL